MFRNGESGKGGGGELAKVLAGKQVKQTVAAGQMSSRSEMGWSGASLHRPTLAGDIS